MGTGKEMNYARCLMKIAWDQTQKPEPVAKPIKKKEEESTDLP